MLDWLEDGGRLGRDPVPPAFTDPIEPTGAPEPGTEGADWGAGLLAGWDGGVDIWF